MVHGREKWKDKRCLCISLLRAVRKTLVLLISLALAVHSYSFWLHVCTTCTTLELIMSRNGIWGCWALSSCLCDLWASPRYPCLVSQQSKAQRQSCLPPLHFWGLILRWQRRETFLAGVLIGQRCPGIARGSSSFALSHFLWSLKAGCWAATEFHPTYGV